jgi:hypothetical protein
MSGDAVFRTSTKSAPPTRQEASATCRGQIEAAVTLALSANVHRIDCADLLESIATQLRVAHSMRTAP